MVDSGQSPVNLLTQLTEYRPVWVGGLDPDGTRYAITPPNVASITNFAITSNGTDPENGLPLSQSTFDANGTERTTSSGRT